jgi:hypothetical protein
MSSKKKTVKREEKRTCKNGGAESKRIRKAKTVDATPEKAMSAAPGNPPEIAGIAQDASEGRPTTHGIPGDVLSSPAQSGRVLEGEENGATGPDRACWSCGEVCDVDANGLCSECVEGADDVDVLMGLKPEQEPEQRQSIPTNRAEQNMVDVRAMSERCELLRKDLAETIGALKALKARRDEIKIELESAVLELIAAGQGKPAQHVLPYDVPPVPTALPGTAADEQFDEGDERSLGLRTLTLHAVGDGDRWREVELRNLDITTGALSRLKEAKILTLGQLADFSNDGRPLTDIPGIGEVAAAKINDALDAFWKLRQDGMEQEVSSDPEDSEVTNGIEALEIEDGRDSEDIPY